MVNLHLINKVDDISVKWENKELSIVEFIVNGIVANDNEIKIVKY